MKNKDLQILQKMQKYSNEIEETMQTFKKSFDLFEQNSTFRNAISMCLLQLGELSIKLSEEFKISHNEIPWHELRGMRNMFAHSYSSLDTISAWDSSIHDVPLLKKFCEEQENIFIKNFILTKTDNEIYEFFSLRRNITQGSFFKNEYEKDLSTLTSMVNKNIPYSKAMKIMKHSDSLKTIQKYLIFQHKTKKLFENQNERD